MTPKIQLMYNSNICILETDIKRPYFFGYYKDFVPFVPPIEMERVYDHVYTYKYKYPVLYPSATDSVIGLSVFGCDTLFLSENNKFLLCIDSSLFDILGNPSSIQKDPFILNIPIPSSEIKQFVFVYDKIYIIDSYADLWEYQIINKNTIPTISNKIKLLQFKVCQNIQVSYDGNSIYIQSNNDLYFFDVKTKNFKLLINDIIDFRNLHSNHIYILTKDKQILYGFLNSDSDLLNTSDLTEIGKCDAFIRYDFNYGAQKFIVIDKGVLKIIELITGKCNKFSVPDENIVDACAGSFLVFSTDKGYLYTLDEIGPNRVVDVFRNPVILASDNKKNIKSAHSMLNI